MAEHLKFESTGGFHQQDVSPCSAGTSSQKSFKSVLNSFEQPLHVKGGHREERDAGVERRAEGRLDLGCNSIDIWNLRLEVGRKVRQGLRTHLGRQQMG